MPDSIPKRAEILLRRLVIRLLRRLTSRNTGPLRDVDLPNARVLFIRQDMIGDVLVSTGLFAALIQKYPRMTLDIILSPKNASALANNPLIGKRWIYTKGLGSTIRLVRDLRRARYDFAVDLMDNPSATATIFSLLAGARWNVGLEKDNAFAYDIVVPLLSRKDRHIIDRLSQLLKPFGIDPGSVDLRPQFYPSPAATEWAKLYWDQEGFAGSPVVGINISAGTDVRFYGVDNFRSLITSLAAELPKARFLLLYKPADSQRVENIATGLPNTRVSFPTASFDEFAALVGRVQLLITPDTSAVHLSSAFRIPCVALYVQSDPNLRIWDPYAVPNKCLVTPVDDLKTIDVGSVVNAVRELVALSNLPF